jgi:hypothetical protein
MKKIFLVEYQLDVEICKVEKILKGSLDLIPLMTPSVKIQIIGWKVCLMSTNFWLVQLVPSLGNGWGFMGSQG